MKTVTIQPRTVRNFVHSARSGTRLLVPAARARRYGVVIGSGHRARAVAVPARVSTASRVSSM